MTLDTRVYVHDQVDPRELFHYCQELLAKLDTERRPADAQVWSDRESYSDDGSRILGNKPDQGLDAWLMLYYRPDAPLRTEPSDDGSRPPCWVEVSFDTGYGYRGPGGARCGDLHAALVTVVGTWCDDRGLRWSWLDECGGKVYERFDGLAELVTGGRAAAGWFEANVLPAIIAHAAQQRGT